MLAPSKDEKKAKPDVLALLRSSGVFGVLPEDALAALAASARIESHKLTTLVYAAGEPMLWLRLVLTGSIELSASSVAGAEVIVAEVPPGQWMPWYGCIADRPAPHDLYCSAGSTCLAVSAARVREVARAHPRLYLPILLEMGARGEQLLEWTMQSVLLKPEQRLAKLLHLLLKNQGVQRGTGVLLLTQTRLARLAGCSRQSLSLMIKGLKQRQLIEGRYGELRIADVAALQAFASENLEEA